MSASTCWLRLLRRAGVAKIGLLTGDRRDTAETVGEALGVDEVLAGLKPPQKLAWRVLRAEGECQASRVTRASRASAN